VSRSTRGAALIMGILITTGLFTPPTATARTDGPLELWASRYDAGSSDSAFFIAASPDGSKVYITGSSTGDSSSFDYATIAYDAATGASLWTRRFNGPANGNDRAQSIVASPDGSRVFVTGSSQGAMFDDYATIAYEAATGAALWTRRFNGPANTNDAPSSIVLTPDGSKVIVTGAIGTETSSSNYGTVAYDASTGATVWVRWYDGPGDDLDSPTSIAISADGASVFVTGFSYGVTSASDYATVAYDASTGASLWTRRYNGPANDADVAASLATTFDGKVLVTGTSFGAASSDDYATIAYDASTGMPLWARRYNGPGNGGDGANSVDTSIDGKAFVTGSSIGVGTSGDYATIGYDVDTGSRLFVRRFNGPWNNSDIAVSVAASPDGSKVFVTGYTWGAGTTFATVAYSTSTGATLWVESYDGPGHGLDFAYGLATSADGSKVFVTGSSEGATSIDYATIAYSA
jgi:outer membrane protein assembly factor BamB